MKKAKKNRLIILSFFVLFLSCNEKQHNKSDSLLLDSLSNHCYALMSQLQTDSLRDAAEIFIKAAIPYSQEYFKARQYYINSYFNAHDYDKVLDLLTTTEKMKNFKNYSSIYCDYQYTRARVFQYTNRYPEAIDVFKKCLTFDVPKEEQVKILPTLLASMTQLMNSYMLSNKTEKGYAYFKQLKENPTPTIKRFALRDLYSHLGYLAIQSGRSKEAYRITDSVFVLPLYNPTPEKLFRDYAYASLVFYSNPDTKEQVIQWLKQAIDEADKYDYIAGMEWCMDMLGVLYQQQNRVEESLELAHKALASAEKRKDRDSQCNIYSSLSILYKNWELYKQANEYANQAIKVILPTDNTRRKGVAYNTKADVLKAMGFADSAIHFYQKAGECFKEAQLPGASHEVKTYIANLMIDSQHKDSIRLGVNLIQETLKKIGPEQGRSYHFYCLGKGLIKQGNIYNGESMLDSMYKDASRIKDFAYDTGVLEYVIDHYLSQKNADKVMQYAALYRKQAEIRFNEKITNKISSAMVQYQTEKKEQQLKLVTAELALKDLRIKLYIVALLLLFIISISGILWYFHERKLQKSRQLLTEQEKLIALREYELAESRLHEQEIELKNALESLKDANIQSEQMREQLDEFISDYEKQQNIASITPSIFREKGEVKFRQYFARLYPAFLNSLKNRIPDITRGEEILCMLILLNQNMNEIADVLCIEKKSVKMTRYRLRKKTEIDQDESLDDFIKGLL